MLSRQGCRKPPNSQSFSIDAGLLHPLFSSLANDRGEGKKVFLLTFEVTKPKTNQLSIREQPSWVVEENSANTDVLNGLSPD